MGRRPDAVPTGRPTSGSEKDRSEDASDQLEAVRAALGLRIGPDTDLAAATESLTAAHDALQRRLSDLSS